MENIVFDEVEKPSYLKWKYVLLEGSIRKKPTIEFYNWYFKAYPYL